MKQKSFFALVLGAILVLTISSTDFAFADYDDDSKYDDKYDDDSKYDDKYDDDSKYDDRDDDDDKREKEYRS